MLFRAHPLLRQLFVALLCVIWTVGSLSTQLDDLMHTHIVCAEHETVEHANPQATAVARNVPLSVRAPANPGEHGSVCPIQGFVDVCPAPPPAISPTTSLIALPLLKPSVSCAAPRGPPLDYAPKTSPPLFT